MSDNPAPKKFVVADPPAEYKDKYTKEQKINWLNEHGLPSNDTISLGSCYAHGSSMTNYLQLLYKVIENIKKKVATTATTNQLRKYFTDFATAFNKGIGTFSAMVYKDCKYLLDNGKYSDVATPLEPVEIPEVSVDFEASTSTPKVDISFWSIFKQFLEIVINKYPALKQIQPSISASWADLLTAVMKTGSAFFEKFTEHSEANSGTADRRTIATTEGLPELIQPIMLD